MALLLKLGGVTITKPVEFVIERYDITDSGRVASGLMTMDLIDKKRKFLFRYPVIEGDDMDEILAEIDSTNMFFPIQYSENNVVKDATVYSGRKPSKLHSSDEAGKAQWKWVDFNFDLIEQ